MQHDAVVEILPGNDSDQFVLTMRCDECQDAVIVVQVPMAHLQAVTKALTLLCDGLGMDTTQYGVIPLEGPFGVLRARYAEFVRQAMARQSRTSNENAASGEADADH